MGGDDLPPVIDYMHGCVLAALDELRTRATAAYNAHDESELRKLRWELDGPHGIFNRLNVADHPALGGNRR